MTDRPIISIDSIYTKFGKQVVHKGVTIDIYKGSVVALIGGSGCGKSVLLKEIIGLQRPTSGEIKVFDVDVWKCDEDTLNDVRKRFGILFQNGALFSALNVGDNVGMPLREQGKLSPSVIDELIELKLSLAGLAPSVKHKMPSELSGGMRKRVALARALSLEPELLFLDEPTSGLDPINAREFDKLVRILCDSLGLTVVMVTHDLDTLVGIVDNIVVLAEGKVLASGSYKEVSSVDHPWIRSYFSARAI